MFARNAYLRVCYREYDFSDAESFRDAMLAHFSARPLLVQFKERKIVAIRKTSLHDQIFALLDPVDDGFYIALNRESTMRQWLADIGHELAHTFHFDATKQPPENWFPGYQWGQDEMLENFCDSFARRWLLQDQNLREFVALLQSEWQGDVLWIPTPL